MSACEDDKAKARLLLSAAGYQSYLCFLVLHILPGVLLLGHDDDENCVCLAGHTAIASLLLAGMQLLSMPRLSYMTMGNTHASTEIRNN